MIPCKISGLLLRFKTMRGIISAIVLALACAVQSRAAVPITVESNYLWDTYFSSFSNVTSKEIDVAGLGGAGVSRTGGNVVGFAYKILSVGNSAQFTVSQTTKTYGPGATAAGSFNNPSVINWAGTIPSISTSSVIGVPAGTTMDDAYEGKFQALTINPVFTFSSLSGLSTTYIWVEIGRQKMP